MHFYVPSGYIASWLEVGLNSNPQKMTKFSFPPPPQKKKKIFSPPPPQKKKSYLQWPLNYWL